MKALVTVAAMMALWSISTCAQAQLPGIIPPDSEIRVKMTTAVSSRLNKAGDSISGVVVSPEQFKGSTLEGEIKEAKSSGSVKKKSVLNFAFKTLAYKNPNIPSPDAKPIFIPVQANVKSMVNSKGKENVDEEGRIIEKQGNVGKIALITGAGAGIGALAGGGRGAGIGAAAGAAAALLFVSVGVKGPDIHFEPGSEFILTVKERAATTGQ